MSKPKWEAFTITSSLMAPTAGDICRLLEQVESQGYEAKFMTVAQNGAQVFGKLKEEYILKLNSSESELGNPSSVDSFDNE